MLMLNLVLIFGTFSYVCEAGVTEIPRDSSDSEAIIETVSDETWMPSNIFDVKAVSDIVNNDVKASVSDFSNVKTNDFGIHANDDISTTAIPQDSGIQNLLSTEANWDSDSSPIFRAIRDFIFQASDGVLEPEDERNEDPTEEIVKILEKGLIEATTMFLNPTEEQVSTTATVEAPSSEISIVKIENVSPDSMLDRIGMNVLDLSSSRQVLSITNTTTACSDCYNSLQTCVQKCFAEHNCNDVQRQARVCPTPTTRLCNIFAQWGPVDECKVHEDCASPLLCCNDGCINKCSPGVWQS